MYPEFGLNQEVMAEGKSSRVPALYAAVELQGYASVGPGTITLLQGRPKFGAAECGSRSVDLPFCLHMASTGGIPTARNGRQSRCL